MYTHVPPGRQQFAERKERVEGSSIELCNMHTRKETKQRHVDSNADTGLGFGGTHSVDAHAPRHAVHEVSAVEEQLAVKNVSGAHCAVHAWHTRSARGLHAIEN
jgi:hypothetical protein